MILCCICLGLARIPEEPIITIINGLAVCREHMNAAAISDGSYMKAVERARIADMRGDELRKYIMGKVPDLSPEILESMI